MIPIHGHPVIQDEAFIDLIRSGGAAAAAARKALYVQHSAWIRASVTHQMHKHTGYRGGADDLVHDSYIVLIRKLEKGYLPTSPLALVWRGISYHLLFNQERKDDKVILVADDHASFDGVTLSPEDNFIENESRETLLGCFSQLPLRCQKLLRMWMDNYTIAEITARLELSNEAMTRKVKYNCFKKIKDLVRSGHKLPFPRHNKEE